MGEFVPPPAEAFRVDRAEIGELCLFREKKELGGLIVRSNETVPANGWAPAESDDEEDIVIPRGSDDCVMMHVDTITGVQKVQHDLVLAGTYVALHEQLRRREFVVGVTFEPLARLAERVGGFGRIRPYGSTNDAYHARLSAKYADMRIAERRPLALAMVYMRTETFVDRYAVKRLGRSASALWELTTGSSLADVGKEIDGRWGIVGL